ncbi:MAG: SHOCT domain-containing protein [Alphaproteobacteria bacterium]|nr:SHOCT domain-containing protein [Alphaproteobacteria bacterium]
MDIEKLEKINDLKEKGIISEDEFNKIKAELITDATNNKDAKIDNNKKNRINWKNLGMSFLITSGVFILSFLILGIDATDVNIKGFSLAVSMIVGIIYTFIAIKLETKKYKNCCPAGFVFIGCYLVGAIGIWILTYEFLQIKQGNAILKD